jgi:hypothetical protein
MEQRCQKWKTVILRLGGCVVALAAVLVVCYYLAMLFLARVISPALEPPEHHIIIDKVEPEVPGLKLGEHPGNLPSRMDLVITNYTGQDVYVIDPQINQMVKIAGGGGVYFYYKDENGNWALFREAAGGSGDAAYIDFHTYPFMSYGRRETSWVLEGKIDDTPFKIYGRTVCVKNCIKG